jgi:hypothetical protein
MKRDDPITIINHHLLSLPSGPLAVERRRHPVGNSKGSNIYRVSADSRDLFKDDRRVFQ